MNFEVVIRGQKQELLDMCTFFIPKDWHVRILRDTSQIGYFKELLNTEYDWVVNIDEDAFLINSEIIYYIMDYMSATDTVYCGVLDGGQMDIRPANPVSMNPFFNVFNVRQIKRLIDYNNYDQKMTETHSELVEKVKGDDSYIFKNLDRNKLKSAYSNCYFEGYYPFFYFLYKNFKFEILDAKLFDKKVDLNPVIREQADITTVLSFSGRDFLYHTWYGRHYDGNQYHTERIDKIFNICRDYLDMKYITFIIQYTYDSPDRLENVRYVVNDLKEKCPCSNIFVYELGKERTFFDVEGIDYKYNKISDGHLWHRTKDFNDIIKEIDTPYVCLYDTDVFLDMKDHYDALRMLKEGYDVVYPYSGQFAPIDRKYLKDGIIRETGRWNFDFLGGAVYLNRNKYIEAGLENENLITYGIDDMERYDRMKLLDYKIGRTSGVCWHINH